MKLGEKYSPELAQEVLKRYPDLEPVYRDYFLAIIEGRVKELYLKDFIYKRDGYSDEVLDTDVRDIIDWDIYNSDYSGRMTRYKCQGNYLVSLSLSLRRAIAQEVIADPEIIESIRILLESDLNFTIGDPENVDRIARINEILDLVIGYLEAE